MSNERDELARLLADHEDCAFSASGVLVCSCGAAMQPNEVMEDLANLAAHQADILTAAGYRKPRTVESVEELDALPIEAVVRCRKGAGYEKFPDEDGLDFWMMIGTQRPFASKVIALPATVLYEPEPQP